MSVTRLALSLVVVVIFTVSVFFAASNMLPNPANNPFAQVTSPTPEVTARQLVSGTSSPSQTETPTVTASRIIPRFYGTISYGSNRSFALTEDQAWIFAEDFLEKAGIANIQASEVIPLGQSIWTDKENNQDVVWSFRVDRATSGVNKGGIIRVNAYDGDVVDYTGLP